MLKSKHISILCAVVLLFMAIPTQAEILVSENWGYALDLPEGFTLTQKNDEGDSYLFEHTILPVQVVVRLYPITRFDTSKKALDFSFSSLNASGETTEVDWRNADCLLSNFSMSLNNTGYEGWALTTSLPEKKGILLVMAYSSKQYASDCEQFVLSVIDSINIDRGSFYTAGPVTTFAFPPEGDITETVTINDTDIEVILDKSDDMANQFVIDREYAVLTLYASSDLWREAWKRYYRLVYRDAYSRMQRAAFSIYGSLYPTAFQMNANNPQLAMAQLLLSWTQTFDYDRNPTGSDFTSLPAIFMGKGSDCDARALLLAVLNTHMGTDSAIFVSNEYKHAVFGAVLDAPGAKIEVNGKNFLLGETTAPVNIGLIASDMNDTDKWIPVLSY